MVLYLLLIMPHMIGRADGEPFKKVLYAHRGLHDNNTDAPENSLAAFRKAVEGGYGIELDIQLSKDDIPVVFHDFTLERVCGVKGRIREYSFEELKQFTLFHTKESIPGFEEVLRLVNGKVPLIVEFKIEDMDISLCPIADKLLREYQGEYCMESFHPQAVSWYRRNHKEIMRGQLADAFVKKQEYTGGVYFLLQNLWFNFYAKPDFIAYNHKYCHLLSPVLCRKLYHSIMVAWTIKSEEELSRAREFYDMFIFDSFIPAQGSRGYAEK